MGREEERVTKPNEYQCASCAKFGTCTTAVLMSLAGKVVFCGRWEKDYKTGVERSS